MVSGKGKCIVIGAGELSVSEVLTEEGDYVIAVDGGFSYCSQLKLKPDLIIGDFDSVSEKKREAIEKLKEQMPHRIITLPPEKDDTDMLAALKHGLSLGYTDFRIYAGCGGRLDHTLANLQCLLYLKNHNAAGCLMDRDTMIFVLQNETMEFKGNMQGILSLFSMGKEAKGVTLRGMKYPLADYTMRNDFPIGISNEFTGQPASVSVRDGALLCIFSYKANCAI